MLARRWGTRAHARLACLGAGRKTALTVLVLATAMVGPVGLTVAAQWARADFSSVDSSYVSRQIAVAPLKQGSPVAIGATVVRPDGWIIVGILDQPLHLLPPNGGEISDANAFGPPDLLAFAAVMRKGLLYVAVRQHTASGTCPIVVLDPKTGQQMRSIEWSQCQWPVVALDPLNDDLVMQAFTKSACSPCALDGHGIVDFNPDDGTSTTLVKQPFGPYSEALAFSPDGQTLFVAEEPNAESTPRKDPTVYIDAYPRLAGAASTYRIAVPSGNSPDGLAYLGEAPCFNDSLLFADDFGSVFAVAHPSPTSTSAITQIATSAQPITPSYANESEITLDRNGSAIIGSFNSAMELSCPGLPRPPPPPPPARPQPPRPAKATTPALVAAVAPPARPTTKALRISAPVHVAPPQPPPALPPGPGLALQPAQAASQVAVAPGSAGLIDVPQEEAVLHMAASSRASGVAPWVILGGGATLLTGLALLSWFALGLAPGALRPARAEVTRR